MNDKNTIEVNDENSYTPFAIDNDGKKELSKFASNFIKYSTITITPSKEITITIPPCKECQTLMTQLQASRLIADQLEAELKKYLNDNIGEIK